MRCSVVCPLGLGSLPIPGSDWLFLAPLETHSVDRSTDAKLSSDVITPTHSDRLERGVPTKS